MHTSKACNIISKYTAFVPVDINKRRYLPSVVKYPNSGKACTFKGGAPSAHGLEEGLRWPERAALHTGVQGHVKAERLPAGGSANEVEKSKRLFCIWFISGGTMNGRESQNVWNDAT